MPEIELRSMLSPDRAASLRQRWAREAKRIGKLYRQARDAYAQACIRDGSNHYLVGKKRVKRVPVPPFLLPDNVLKTELYRLACEVDQDGDALNELEILVRKRGRRRGRIHRPPNGSAVEWVMRLVADSAYIANPRGRLAPINGLTDTMRSRWTTELEFALEHDIDPKYVTMFIDYVGGEELISAYTSLDDYAAADRLISSKMQFVRRDRKTTSQRRQKQALADLEEDANAQSEPLPSENDEGDGWED